MGYMIITKSKKDKMADLVEDMLFAGGRLMSCLEELSEDEGYNMRYQGRTSMRDGGRYGNRDSYGTRSGYGNRDDEWEDEMNERRNYRRRY